MTLETFESLVKEYQPKFNLRYKGGCNVVGLYMGEHYIGYRLNYGDLPMDNFYTVTEFDEDFTLKQRGRREILKLLVSRHLLTQPDAARILYGYSKN